MKQVLIYFLILAPVLLSAQSDVLDKEKWQKLRAEVEFAESAPEQPKNPTEGSKGDTKTEKESSSGATLNLGPLLQLVIIALFILFLGALLYTIFSNVNLQKRSTEIQQVTTDAIASIEENFSKSNLDKWLKHAIDQQDYYLILRIRFLMILKSLENKHLILWKKDKTNWHYIQELDNHHFQSPFKELVFDFDHVWYGEKKYSNEELIGKIDQFESFQDMVDK